MSISTELLDYIFIILSFESERLRWLRTTVSHRTVRDKQNRDDLRNIGIEIFLKVLYKDW